MRLEQAQYFNPSCSKEHVRCRARRPSPIKGISGLCPMDYTSGISSVGAFDGPFQRAPWNERPAHWRAPDLQWRRRPESSRMTGAAGQQAADPRSAAANPLHAALAGRTPLRLDPMAAPHPGALGVPHSEFPRIRPACLFCLPLQTILRQVLVTPGRVVGHDHDEAVRADAGTQADSHEKNGVVPFMLK
jgi:hypothetical protein